MDAYIINGAGNSVSLLSGHKTAINQFNIFLDKTRSTDDSKLKDYKHIPADLKLNKDFTVDDLRIIANQFTFEAYAGFLVTNANAKTLKNFQNTKKTSIELDDDGQDYSHVKTVLQYLSNFQNAIVKLDTFNSIEFFNQFRVCSKGISPSFITNIRSGIRKQMALFLMKNGILLKDRSAGFSKHEVEQLNNLFRKEGIRNFNVFL